MVVKYRYATPQPSSNLQGATSGFSKNCDTYLPKYTAT